MNLVIFRGQSSLGLKKLKGRGLAAAVIAVHLNSVVQLKIQLGKSSVRAELNQLRAGFSLTS